MQKFFSSITKKQTLYTVIPLALSVTNREEHLSVISASSDCLLLEEQDITKKTFKFFKKNIALFSTYKKKSHEKIALQMPFTSLLIGPAYSCKKLLSTYYTWAHTAPNVFAVPIPKNKKISTLHTKNSSVNDYNFRKHSHWRKFTPPKVWAKASLSNIEVPCVSPNDLKKELTSFFDSPITLTALPISSYENHNEALAWTYALYALSVARQVGRHVMCHYKSINNQFTIYNKSRSDTPTIQTPKLWSAFIQPTIPNYQIKSINKIEYTKNDNDIKKCIRVLNNHSNYIKKEKIENFTKTGLHCLGFSHVYEPVLAGHSSCDATTLKKYIITLNKEYKLLVFTLPFLPSANTLHALKKMAATTFNTKAENIAFEISKSSCIPPRAQEYSILGNLMLQIAKKKSQRAKILTASIPKYIYKCNSHISCSLEFEVNKYDKMLNFKKAYMTINAGYIAQETLVRGLIERITMQEIDTFLGRQHMYNSLPLYDISFIYNNHIIHSKKLTPVKKKTPIITHTSSISNLIRVAVWNAIHNAISNYYTNMFPHTNFHIKTKFIEKISTMSFPNANIIIPFTDKDFRELAQ